LLWEKKYCWLVADKPSEQDVHLRATTADPMWRNITCKEPIHNIFPLLYKKKINSILIMLHSRK
jgi:hypothetical protein